VNPLLTKHLLSSLRKNRFFWLLSAYLLGVGILTASFTATPLLPALFGGSTSYSMIEIMALGRNIFRASGILLMLAAGLLVPLSTLGAVSGEREHHTFDLLVITKLKPWNIVWGKMLSACFTGFIYLCAPLPLVLASYWLGGVSFWELGILLLIVVVVMFFSCSLAMFFSSIVRKTISAIVAYYILHIGALPILLIITILLGNSYSGFSQTQHAYMGHSLFLATLVQYGWVLLSSLHPLSAVIASEVLGMEQKSWFLLTFDVNQYDPTRNIVSLWARVQLPSPWIPYCLLALFASVFLLWQTTKCISRLDA
jgi:ABC-type transport system involved in multi-copper enzyme maturation permease subunit